VIFSPLPAEIIDVRRPHSKRPLFLDRDVVDCCKTSLENFPRRKTFPIFRDDKIIDSRRHPQTDIGDILDMAGEKKRQQPVWLGYATLDRKSDEIEC
jgi:hypothetical protein